MSLYPWRALLLASAFLTVGTLLPAQDPEKPKEPQEPQEPQEPKPKTQEEPDDGAPVGRVPPYKEALKIYHERLKRKSLMKRVEGRMMLAATKEPEALKVLAASYGKTEPPRDEVRYLLVGIVLRYFTDESSREPFAAWRSKNIKARDAWLWFWTLRSPWMARHKDELLGIAQGKENTFLRAAALEALARLVDGKGQEPELAAAVSSLLEAPPTKPTERSVLVESCAAVLLAQKKVVRDPTWKPICSRLIEFLGDKDIDPRSKLALSRHFARLFDTPNLGFEPRMWQSKLMQGPAPEQTKDGTAAAFFGVPSLGERICYVIDASDSMLKALTREERQRLRELAGPRTGPAGADTSLPVEKRLPWDKMRNRFDVAREYLKLSLQDLDKTKSFAVVLFGSEVETLKATPKLMPATSSVVSRAISELDKLRKKTGAERQNTNMHGGMLQAFRMTRANVMKKEEHVSLKALESGCDTIYLLSDGEPSWDNYGDLDKRDEGDGVMNPETGEKFKNQQVRGYYWGPYGRKPHKHMLDDFQRMNLFRKVQIHCVGIGEADQGLLDKIAALGMGRVVKITAQKPR